MTPSIMAPAYVVYRELDNELVYFQSDYTDDRKEDGSIYQFSPHKGGALIYQTLQHAARVAKAEVACIRVLTCREDAAEFDRA